MFNMVTSTFKDGKEVIFYVYPFENFKYLVQHADEIDQFFSEEGFGIYDVLEDSDFETF